MLDAGNPEPSKAKKTKPQSKPPQRFWPFGTSQNSTPLGTDPLTVTSPSAANLDVNSGQAVVISPQNKAIVLPTGTCKSASPTTFKH